MIGQVFGRLTVLRESEERRNNRKSWVCQCTCGNQITANTDALKRNTKSCGCLKREICSSKGRDRAKKVEGINSRAHPLYSTYRSMINRCEYPSHLQYKNYGGRGIRVCEEWRKDFSQFVKDVGERPEGLTLDRVDNDGDYEPTNVRWATRKEQSANRSKR